MLLQMVMGLVVVLFHGSIFERAVHAFHLAIGPGMVGFGEAVLDAKLLADALKDMLEGVAIARAVGELNAIISEHRVDLIRHSGHQVPEELSRDHVVGVCMQLGIGQFACSSDGDKQAKLAFFRAHFGNIDVEVADWIALERFLLWLVTLDGWQAADAVPLQAAMEGRSRQLRPGRLQGIQAVVERS